MANVSNHTQFAQVYGTNDPDNIDNFAYGAAIYAYGSNDLVRNFYAQYSSVYGGNGDDTIHNLSDPRHSFSRRRQ